MSFHKQPRRVSVSTLRLLADDVISAAKDVERTCDSASGMEIRFLDVKFTESAERLLSVMRSVSKSARENLREGGSRDQESPETSRNEEDEMIKRATAQVKKASIKRVANKKVDPKKRPRQR